MQFTLALAVSVFIAGLFLSTISVITLRAKNAGTWLTVLTVSLIGLTTLAAATLIILLNVWLWSMV